MGSAKSGAGNGEHPGTLERYGLLTGEAPPIEAVRVLEEKGFRAAVIEAMTKVYGKMQKKKLSKS